MANWAEQQGAEQVAALQREAPWNLHVRNDTTYHLVNSEVDASANLVDDVPNIQPNNQVTVGCRAVWAIPLNSHGTVSWLVEGLDRRIIIMWEAPDYFGNENGVLRISHFKAGKLAVGISRRGVTTSPEGRSWYEVMHDAMPEAAATHLKFVRVDVSYETTAVTVRDDNIEIEGQITVDQEDRVDLKLTIRPVTGGADQAGHSKK